MAAPLAEAFVRLRIDSSDVSSDIKKSLSGTSTKTAMSSAGKDAGGRFRSSFGSAIKGLAAPITAALSVGAATQFLGASIGEAREAQKVGAQTATVLKSTRHEAGLTATEISNLAGALSAKAGVDDEVIQSGENVLLTFTNIRDEVGKGNDIFSRATGIALDMSTALGTDLQGSVIQVGKALNDPVKGITALSRVGVSFTEEQKEQIATLVKHGKTLEAQKVILGELTKEFQGSAAAQATFGDKAKVAFGNFEEEVGTALLPLLDKVQEWFVRDGMPKLEQGLHWVETDGVDALKQFGQEVKPLADDLLPQLGDAAVGVFHVAQNLAPIVGDLAHAFSDMPEPLQKVALFMGALTASGAVGKVNQLATGFQGFAANLRDSEKRAGALSGTLRSGGIAVGLGGIAASLTETNDGLSAIESIGGFAALGFGVGGGVGALIGAAGGGMLTLAKATGLFGDNADDAKPQIADFSDTLAALTGNITKSTRALVAQTLEQQGLLQQGAKLGISGATLIDSVLGKPEAMAITRDAFAGALEVATDKVNKAQDAVDRYSEKIANQVSPATVEQQQHLDKLIGRVETAGDKYDNLKDQAAHFGAVLDGNRSKLASDIASLRREREAVTGVHIDMGKLRDVMKLIPPAARTEIEALGVDATKRDVIDITSRYKGIDGIELTALLKLLGYDDTTRKTKTVQTLLDAVGNTFPKPLVELLGFDTAQRHTKDTKDKLDDLDRQRPKPVVDVETTGAINKVRSFVQTMGGLLRGIPNESVTVSLAAQAQSIVGQIGGLFKASGGAIPFIPGARADKDSVPIIAMPDEHMWTTAEVRAAGGGSATKGHRVMEAMRRMALRGELTRYGDLQPFADGGAVVRVGARGTGTTGAINSVEATFARIAEAIGNKLSGVISNKIEHMPTGGQLGPGGRLTPAQVVRGQQFASAQVGKPYIWGGVGPGGYDCSGFQSAVLNAAVGVNPYQRRGSTGTMPWPGSRPGTGVYTIGWSTNVNGTGIGHTSGNIGGLNVESYGGHGPAVGGGARSPLDPMFHGLMHYDSGGILRPGITVAINKTGRDELITPMAVGGPVRRAIRQFGFGPGQSASETRSEIRDLISALRDILGHGAPLLQHIRELGSKLVGLQRQQDKLANQYGKAKDEFKSLMQAQHEEARTIAQAYMHDAFGGSLADTELQLRADIADARRGRRNLQRARRHGLSRQALRAIAESGNVELEEEIGHASRAEIRRLNNLLRERRDVTSAFGRSTASQLFSKERRQDHRDMVHAARAMNHAARELQRVGDRVEDGTRRAHERRHRRNAARRRTGAR